MRKCSKTRFLPLQTLKNIFFKNLILVLWKYAQRHQNMYITTSDIKQHHVSGGLKLCENAPNTFLSNPDVKKYLFKELDFRCQEVCANASKHVFNHFRR
jgi:hypothetical protein